MTDFDVPNPDDPGVPVPTGDPAPAPTQPPRNGPFAVDPVDPLVYKQQDDSPELRPAASYVSVGPQLRAKAPKPVLPGTQSYQDWTPGGIDAAGPRSEPDTGPTRADRVGAKLALLFAILAPVVIILLGVWYAVEHT